MKKILILVLVALMVFAICVLPVMAETEPPATEAEEQIKPSAAATEIVTDEPEPTPGPQTPFTWAYLATIAGATAATLLIVQFLKLPLDKAFGNIPTRLVAYAIALIIMLVATAFTTGLTAENALLAVVNAFVVALAAMGGYEITFAKAGK